MNKSRLMKVLLASHMSEKSTFAADSSNQHVFRVVSDATKGEIRRAVEMLFSVKVTAVRLMNVKGKRKRFGRIEGRRSGWKKAYVRLVAGDDIDIAGMD
jgi:large subunit ribosomal protein L23